MIQGTYRNNVMYGEFRNESPILVKLIIITYMVAFMLFFLSIELHIQLTSSIIRTRFVITAINIILIISVILSSVNQARMILAFIFFPFTMLMVFVTIFYLTKWSKFEFKAISSLLLLGLSLILGGISLTDPLAKSINVLPLFIPPLMVTIGTVIAISPLLINYNFLSRTMTYWKIVGIVINGVYLFFLVYVIINQFPISVLILIIFVNIMMMIIIYKIIVMIRFEASNHILAKNKKDELNILGIFTKPSKVTEEEISISKDKKICLVCKNKLKEYIFMCENCNSFYCNKCTNALIQLENMCWACNCQIDKSKPIKPLKTTETIKDDILKHPKRNL